jgi:hypothetical protein
MQTHKHRKPAKPLTEREKRNFRTALITGAEHVNQIYLEESKAWNPLEEEVALMLCRSIDPKSHNEKSQ